MLTSIQSAGVAPEVNLRITQVRKHMGIHLGFETRHHQKSKTVVSVAPRKGLMSSKNYFKKDYLLIIQMHFLIISSGESQTSIIASRHSKAQYCNDIFVLSNDENVI